MRGQNRKVHHVAATCPECRAPLHVSDWAEEIAARLCELPYELDDGWLGQCETLNCPAHGRRDGALRIYLVTEGERQDWSFANYDSDVVEEETEQVAHIDADGGIHLHHRQELARARRRQL